MPVMVRDRLGELFPDAEFAPGFGARGRPGWSPGRLALVTVLQMAENLTDRQAADAVRDKISWKYALGLDLDDEGFDSSVLSEFRTRVVEHGLEQRVLDLLLDALVEQGLVGAGGKQRTDSTHVISAVRDLNRLELAGESVRACVEAVAAAAPDWLQQLLSTDGARTDELVARALLSSGLTVATGESCTGGMLASRLVDRAGSSAYVAGGVVAYANAAKAALLGVPAEMIAEHGAVSPEVARALADGARERFGADIGVGITGVAGPDGGTEAKPVGTVSLCVTTGDGVVIARDVRMPGSRADIRERSTDLAMYLLLRATR